MRIVPAEFSWEIPQPSHVLIAAALAYGRPVALESSAPRLNGLPSEEVARRHEALVHEMRALGDPGGAHSLEALERGPGDQGYPPWESLVMRTGAADDVRIIGLARDVWEALGPNEYARRLRARPRTYRGSLEGRVWLALAVFGTVAVVIAAEESRSRWGLPWWAWGLAACVWPAVVLWFFLRRYRRLTRRGDMELPHF